MSERSDSPPALPLEDLVVADFSRILAGPLATQMLADDGARVIKVEEPGRGDETRRWGPPFVEGESAYFLSINRGKESLTLDLREPAGRDAAQRLITKADVVLHNFRPDQEVRYGLDSAAVASINPRAVHCAIRGFEPGSEEASLPGYDLLAQAAGGLMAITGPPDGDPMKVGVALSDILTAHWARGAILSALFERERGGPVRSIEVSLLGATVASLANVAQSYLLTRTEPRRWGNAHPSIVPYEAFRAADRLFVVAVGSDRQWQALCRDVLNDERLAELEAYATNPRRVRSRDVLIPILQRAFAARAAQEWVERCRSAGIPAALVSTYDELFSGAGASLVTTVEHPGAGVIPMVASPVRYGGERHSSDAAPPRRGAASVEILRELGFSAGEIDGMLERRITSTADQPTNSAPDE